LQGVLFDLDDTLLDRGRLTEQAYSALFRLRESGLVLAAVTGRPAGWGKVLARQWPVAGVVTENGAVTLTRTGDRVHVRDAVAPDERLRRRERLSRLVAELRARFPELQPADDVHARISDFTFDIGEHHEPPHELVQAAAECARERGARVTRSSVHLHVTWDGDDKASGAVRFLRHVVGLDPTAARSRFAFVGDSENDEACFSAFHTTIAVENFTGRPTLSPRFVTRGGRSAGFVELAKLLVERRGGPPAADVSPRPML
jgi:hypothetical protein